MLVHVLVLRYLSLARCDLVWYIVYERLVVRNILVDGRVLRLVLGRGPQVVAYAMEFFHVHLHFLRLKALVDRYVRVQRVALCVALGNALVHGQAWSGADDRQV